MKRSPTQRALDNLIFQPAKVSRNKSRPIASESGIKTYDAAWHMRKSQDDRMRARRL